jgi:hypothetical protein
MTGFGALAIAALVCCAPGSAPATASAPPSGSKQQDGCAQALRDARVSLEEGLAAAAGEGKPIAATFGIGEDGGARLVVYTVKDVQVSEVIVDQQTGQSVMVKAITGDEDLTAAESRVEVMAKANLTLESAVVEAIYSNINVAGAHPNRGYRAVSVFPSLRDGHPLAVITLCNGSQWKTVHERLD